MVTTRFHPTTDLLKIPPLPDERKNGLNRLEDINYSTTLVMNLREAWVDVVWCPVVFVLMPGARLSPIRFRSDSGKGYKDCSVSPLRGP